MVETIGHWDNSDRPLISPRKWQGNSHLDVTIDAIREIIEQVTEQAIMKALQPEPEKPVQRIYPIISKSHIGVEVQFTDFDGQKYRGVLYPSKED